MSMPNQNPRFHNGNTEGRRVMYTMDRKERLGYVFEITETHNVITRIKYRLLDGETPENNRLRDRAVGIHEIDS